MQYKSKFLDSVLEYEEAEKVTQQKKFDELQEMLNKKKNYAKLVMETHKPKVSKRKRMEMELIKQNLQNPTAFERIKKRMVSSSQNRLNSYQALNPGDDKNKFGSDNESIGQRGTERKAKRKYKDFDWREKNRFASIPKPPKEFKKIDYLAEARSHATADGESRTEYRRPNWQAEASKFEGDDKIFHMKEKARLLEEEAIKREQLMNLNNGGGGVNDRNEINDMIIDSIKAKIALLDNIE